MNRNVVQLGQQLRAIWKQLGLNQRISVVLAAGVVLLAMLSLGFWSSRVDYSLLYGRLDDAEAAKVIAYLDEANIPKKIGRAGGALYVPSDQVHSVRMKLAARGIPRGDGVGFEIFDKQNFGISDFVQRANYLRAMQGELARTISQLDEVEAARVMIVMPENRLLVDKQKQTTASVFIRTRGATISGSAVNSIRFLVANSVEGLSPNQVTVVDNRGTVLSENAEANSLEGLTAGQLKARRDLEQYFAKKAETMLEAVVGPGRAVVRVSADINADTLTQTEEKFNPEGQVERSNTTTDETIDSNNASTGGGAPGIASNLGFETNYAGGSPVNATKTKKKVTNTEFEIGKTTSSTTQIAGGVKRLTAAVFVAAASEGTGAARKVVPRTPEELQKLKRIVQNALGIQASTNGGPADAITLEEMPFSEPFAEVARDVGNPKTFWLDQVQNYLYLGLALAVLFIFWRALKRTPVEKIPAGLQLDAYAGDETEPPGGGAPAGGRDLRRSGLPGTVTPDVMNRLVRENPENFTQAIQTWLAAGGNGKN
jgi:flagellar M-ring protein FliF